MHKDVTTTRIEGLAHERAFEEKFGREMTFEEKKFLALSDEMFRHEAVAEPLDRRFDHENGSRMALVSRGEQERQGKRVA